jgi:hypothetical protein
MNNIYKIRFLDIIVKLFNILVSSSVSSMVLLLEWMLIVKLTRDGLSVLAKVGQAVCLQ